MERAEAILRRLDGGVKMAAEVGVLRGQLSEQLLLARPDLRLLMVDSWRTAEAQPEAYKATRDAHAVCTDRRRIAAHREEAWGRAKLFPGRAAIMPMESGDAARFVADYTLDLVFLDADHSYEGVRRDLDIWSATVAPGGWIGGHDYRNPAPAYDFSGVERAVDEWAAARGLEVETDLNFTWFARL